MMIMNSIDINKTNNHISLQMFVEIVLVIH